MIFLELRIVENYRLRLDRVDSFDAVSGLGSRFFGCLFNRGSFGLGRVFCRSRVALQPPSQATLPRLGCRALEFDSETSEIDSGMTVAGSLSGRSVR